MSGQREPLVAVLLGTKDGALYLDEQLESIARQKHPRIDVWASDDGSVDDTIAILNAWSSKWPKGRFEVLNGPCRGFAENYRALIVDESIQANYFAYCDQDDIWETDRLSTGVSAMENWGLDVPQLFCSRTTNIDSTGRNLGISPQFHRPPSFANALVQSIAGANTMMFNRNARDILMKASRRSSFVSHDWWTYMLVTGVGGEVHYSPQPLVRYRQHEHNMAGQNQSLAARVDRFKRLFSGSFSDWNTANIDSLMINQDLLTPEAMASFRLFSGARSGNVVQRISRLRASGVHRQTSLQTLAVAIAAVLGRL